MPVCGTVQAEPAETTGRVAAVTPPAIGLSLTAYYMRPAGPPAGEVAAAAASAVLDFLQVGDHVSFYDGTGFDGMVLAAAAVSAQSLLPVHIGLYLLALRHPVLVARQLADLSRIAPGRINLGVGVGGEDRHEFAVCQVDPATRGRRTDESLEALRLLSGGGPVTMNGQFFQFEEALVLPAPDPRVPIIVGGRSDAALRRTARYGDGWLGLWVSPRRFAQAVAAIDEEAVALGRPAREWRHGLNLWCGLDTPSAAGRDVLGPAMEERYKMPFERFERWCPYGSADDIAAFVAGYAAAGCREVNLVLHDADPFAAVAGAAAIRASVHRMLRAG
jgi:alkanesulfonate monooxygenase SsuD/methylene tetrahydromethanopterin reductase-like flavin-dependent oxidoreductase (luciferase family)